MARFVLLFQGGEAPEEPTREVKLAWLEWFGWLGEESPLVDVSAFGAAVTIGSNGTASQDRVPDPATGYAILEATDLADAVFMQKNAPQ